MGYRTTFVLSLAQVFVLPPVLTTLVLRNIPQVAFLPAPLLALLSIPLLITLRTLWTSHQHARAARRLGALQIPVVRGKWPGNIDVLKRLLHGWRNGYINESLREFFQEYQSPTINVQILWVDQIWTMDPNHIKHILVSGFQHFDKGAPQRERMKGFLGTGIFAADGDMWKMHRTMARPFLAKSCSSDIALYVRHADDVFAQLDRLVDNGPAPSQLCALDIQDLSQRYTLDVALDSFFGIHHLATLRDRFPLPHEEQGDDHKEEVTGSIDGDVTKDRGAMMAFVRAMEEAADTTILRARQGVLWPLIEFRTDKQKEPARVMQRWVDALIKKAKAEAHLNEGKEAETFLEHLVQSTDDEKVIRDQLINMVLGARDTTAGLLTFVFYFLGLHPEVYAKLRAEVMELCPPGESMPEEEQVRKFVYLRAVMNETLRVFPTVPINTRYSNTESTFPPAAFPYSSSSKTPPHYANSLYMPPNTSISLLPLLMQRRVDLWGADAEEFRPSRWLPKEHGGDGVGETAGAGKRPEWFVPFSAGPRLCPGQNFAYAEATYLLIGLVQRGYVFTLAPDCQPVATRPPHEWKASVKDEGKNGDTSIFVAGRGRQTKEQCWPGAAFTLFSKGGLWMYVSKMKE